MIKTLSALLFVFSTIQLFGQFQNYNTENSEWYEGEVQLLEGGIVKGDFNYNFVSDVLRIKQGEKIKVISPEKILMFQLKGENQKKIFYVLPYDWGQGRNVPTFFEVVHQTDEMAILSKHSMEFIHKDFFDNQVYKDYSKDDRVIDLAEKREKIYETIYLADSQGNILPYLTKKKTVTRNVELFGFYEEGVDYDNSSLNRSNTEIQVEKYKYLDKDALEKTFQHNFNILKKYIKRQKLDTRRVKDLISVVEYYSSVN